MADAVWFSNHNTRTGAPAAGGRGNGSSDSLVVLPESDALFRATVEALLLGALIDLAVTTVPTPPN